MQIYVPFCQYGTCLLGIVSVLYAIYCLSVGYVVHTCSIAVLLHVKWSETHACISSIDHVVLHLKHWYTTCSAYAGLSIKQQQSKHIKCGVLQVYSQVKLQSLTHWSVISSYIARVGVKSNNKIIPLRYRAIFQLAIYILVIRFLNIYHPSLPTLTLM